MVQVVVRRNERQATIRNPKYGDTKLKVTNNELISRMKQAYLK